jgi:hypothetical protein
MCRSLIVGLLTVVLSVLESATAWPDSDACWQFVYRAIEHSAAEAHPPYISYSESGDIVQDGRLLERIDAQITYRDDGIASVDDDRWVHPFLSRVLDPGPPVLGPYSDRRATWLSLDEDPYALFSIIADVHNPPIERCVELGTQTIDGTTVVHIVIPDAALDRPAIKSLWINPSTLDFVRVVVSDWIGVWTEDEDASQRALADYTVDVTRVNAYAVVRRVSWQLRLKVFSQESTTMGSFDFTGFSFESTPPQSSLFATHQ